MLREPLTITSGDGLSLEGELIAPDDPWAGAVLTHPHPLHGGNMRSMVPGELAAVLPEDGIATLRFNYRGMGASEGKFEDGIGERLDTIAAIGALHEVVEGLPLVICGSSFGADTALTVTDSRITAWCACAPPLRAWRLDMMQPAAYDPRPKLLVVAENDQFRDPDNVRAVTSDWVNTEIITISGSDHFFVGNLERVGRTCLEFIRKFR